MAATRRRMDPAARRREILDCARDLFAERPYSEVTTADIARAAGVTRALVHHYCGGVRDIFLTVAAEFGAAVATVRSHGQELPFEDRIAANCASYLDMVDENRHLWMAIMAQVIPDSDALELMRAGIELNIERMIQVNEDVMEDTPLTRVALRSYIGFMTIAVREWLQGRATREQTHHLMTQTFLCVTREALPAMAGAD